MVAASLIGIPRWRRPLPEEPAHGLLLHLVELNGYSSAETVADCLGLRASELKVGKAKSLSAFAGMIRCPLDVLTADSPAELPPRKRVERSFRNAKARNTTALKIRSVAISSDQLSRRDRRVCPACLEDSRHHRFWWDLTAITTCPRHELRLVDRCGCGSDARLSWQDTKLFYCGKCSRRTPARRESAGRDVLAADAYLLKRFGVTSGEDFPVLDSMSFFDAVDTLERVGAASIGGLKRKWQSADSLGVDPEVVRARGFSILASGRLTDLLDGLLAEFRKESPDVEPALTTAYGWFYHWLNLKGGRQFSESLSDTFIAHGRNNFHLNGAIELNSGGPVLPATYTLEQAAKECAIGRTSMRKLGVQLGIIREEAKTGQVLVFDGPTVRAVAKDLSESVDQEGAIGRLGLDLVVVKDLVRSGAIAPLFNGRQWRQHYAFRQSDLDAFIQTILGNSRAVEVPREGEMSALDARRRFNLSGALFLRLIAEGHVKVTAHPRKGRGVAGVLVGRQELKSALIAMATREDIPVPVASVALETTNRVVRKLIEKRFLHSAETAGQAVVTAKSFARFRCDFIGLQEIASMLGCEVDRVGARVAKLGIRYKPALGRCGFHCFPRSQIYEKLPELKALLGNDLRLNSPAARESRAA
jgi:hypothetical protein